MIRRLLRQLAFWKILLVSLSGCDNVVGPNEVVHLIVGDRILSGASSQFELGGPITSGEATQYSFVRLAALSVPDGVELPPVPEWSVEKTNAEHGAFTFREVDPASPPQATYNRFLALQQEGSVRPARAHARQADFDIFRMHKSRSEIDAKVIYQATDPRMAINRERFTIFCDLDTLTTFSGNNGGHFCEIAIQLSPKVLARYAFFDANWPPSTWLQLKEILSYTIDQSLLN